ncbi:CDP-alcohol phosphatidyltransferase family protein [Marinicrinis sediminis]|uniref:CDP-alcohol phosphatidyltransferase family protein n=1 Tax=Marinicrinis sediminis TaxID=1652465 RepID=A0ABW5RC19_9BACL
MNKFKAFPPLQFSNVANGLTSLSLLFGFVSVLLLMEEYVFWAYACYVLVILLDRLDGAVARRLGQTTAMGKQLDSLADALNFTLYPPLLFWLSFQPAMWTVPFMLLYLLSGVWRLGYFNLSGMRETNRDAYFIGVPTTVCASWFVILLAALSAVEASNQTQTLAISLYFLSAAVAMCSALPYAKKGLATKSLYVLLPVALWFLW